MNNLFKFFALTFFVFNLAASDAEPEIDLKTLSNITSETKKEKDQVIQTLTGNISAGILICKKIANSDNSLVSFWLLIKR